MGVLAIGLCSPSFADEPRDSAAIVPAEVQPGLDARGRTVVPADLISPGLAGSEVRRFRVWVWPPAGPGPVEVEVELPAAVPIGDGAP